jgi:hypothetical protein
MGLNDVLPKYRRSSEEPLKDNAFRFKVFLRCRTHLALYFGSTILSRLNDRIYFVNLFYNDEKYKTTAQNHIVKNQRLGIMSHMGIHYCYCLATASNKSRNRSRHAKSTFIACGYQPVIINIFIETPNLFQLLAFFILLKSQDSLCLCQTGKQYLFQPRRL